MLLADSRSSRHPRRGALGSKLLETLVQILVLRETPSGFYESRSLSIDELAEGIRQRYGLIINGVGEKRFANADVEMNYAFRTNMDAFKNKLRQIGFYTDMSDACILQKFIHVITCKTMEQLNHYITKGSYSMLLNLIRQSLSRQKQDTV